MKIRREITALNFVHQGEAGKIIGLWEEKKKKERQLVHSETRITHFSLWQGCHLFNITFLFVKLGLPYLYKVFQEYDDYGNN